MQLPLLQIASITSHVVTVRFWENSSLHFSVETGLRSPLSKAVFSPDWTSPISSASHQRTSAPVPPDHNAGPPLNFIWYVNVLLVLESPRRDTVLQPWTHKRNIEGENDFPWSASCSFNSSAAWGAIGGLCCQTTLLPGPFLLNHFPASWHHTVQLHGVMLSWGQNFAFVFVEFHDICVTMFQRDLDGLEDSSPALQYGLLPGLVSSWTWGGFVPPPIAIKVIKEYQLWYEPLRNQLATSCQLSSLLVVTTFWTLQSS